MVSMRNANESFTSPSLRSASLGAKKLLLEREVDQSPLSLSLPINFCYYYCELDLHAFFQKKCPRRGLNPNFYSLSILLIGRIKNPQKKLKKKH